MMKLIAVLMAFVLCAESVPLLSSNLSNETDLVLDVLQVQNRTVLNVTDLIREKRQMFGAGRFSMFGAGPMDFGFGRGRSQGFGINQGFGFNQGFESSGRLNSFNSFDSRKPNKPTIVINQNFNGGIANIDLKGGRQNIGPSSINNNNVAKGSGSSVSNNNVASGSGPASINNNNLLKGSESTAINNNNVAGGQGSTSINNNNVASGRGTASINNNNVNTGRGSVAINNNNVAAAGSGAAINNNNVA